MNTGQDNFYTIGNKETAETRNQQMISNGGNQFAIEHQPRVKTANGMRKSKKVLQTRSSYDGVSPVRRGSLNRGQIGYDNKPEPFASPGDYEVPNLVGNK